MIDIANEVASNIDEIYASEAKLNKFQQFGYNRALKHMKRQKSNETLFDRLTELGNKIEEKNRTKREKEIEKTRGKYIQYKLKASCADDCVKFLKAELSKLLRNSVVNRELQKELTELNDHYDENYKMSDYKFEVDVFEECDDRIILVICDSDQSLCIAAHNHVIEPLSKTLSNNVKLMNKHPEIGEIDTGDGDEGCIYIMAGGYYEKEKH